MITKRFSVISQPLMGGMGIVYICLDRKEDRPIALKTFKPEFFQDRAARDLFLREGTAWVELGEHPNIVNCYEVVGGDGDRETYLVLELIVKEQGREDASLRNWILPGCALSVPQALLFAIQIARGMKHAEVKIPGFVHRDLKPENILVGADKLPGTSINRLRVTDFGLASVIENYLPLTSINKKSMNRKIISGRTQLSANSVGTPEYMAPEQWRNEKVGIYTDVYAFGCILYEMLTGYCAMDTSGMVDVAEIGMAHCNGRLRPIPISLPPDVIKLVQILTSTNPHQRPNDWGIIENTLAQVYTLLIGAPVPQSEFAGMEGTTKKLSDGWSYNVIGVSYLELGKAEVAGSYLERALSIANEVRNPDLLCIAFGNLGKTYNALGERSKAIEYYEKALIVSRKIDFRRGEGYFLGALGETYFLQGET